MEISKSDWQYFRSKTVEWQEAYMDKLIKEYAALLSENKYSSEKFWELERRINEDKHKSGVMLEMRRSAMIHNLIALINDGVISPDDLDGFSDEVKETVLALLRR